MRPGGGKELNLGEIVKAGVRHATGRNWKAHLRSSKRDQQNLAACLDALDNQSEAGLQKELLPRSIELDDIVQTGCTGLLAAYRCGKYDAARGSFGAYARTFIVRAILSEYRRHNFDYEHHDLHGAHPHRLAHAGDRRREFRKSSASGVSAVSAYSFTASSP